MSEDKPLLANAYIRYRESKFSAAFAGFWMAGAVTTLSTFSGASFVLPFIGEAAPLISWGAMLLQTSLAAGYLHTAVKTYKQAEEKLTYARESKPEFFSDELPEKPSKLALAGNFIFGMFCAPTVMGVMSTGLGLGLISNGTAAASAGGLFGALTKGLTWLINRTSDQALKITDKLISDPNIQMCKVTAKTYNKVKKVEPQQNTKPKNTNSQLTDKTAPVVNTNSAIVTEASRQTAKDQALRMVDNVIKNGWSKVELEGPDDFKRIAWLELSLRDVETEGYEPDTQDLKRLAQEMSKLDREVFSVKITNISEFRERSSGTTLK